MRKTTEEKQKEHFKSVKYRMREEGFDYCFEGYSDWTEIEDEKFHELRTKYLESMMKLKKYIEEKVKQYEN